MDEPLSGETGTQYSWGSCNVSPLLSVCREPDKVQQTVNTNFLNRNKYQISLKRSTYAIVVLDVLP